MTEHLEHLLMKYRSKGVMVDTNLLLLFFIGSIDRSLVETFKRTRTFVVEDFDLLLKFLECFERICTCPQVLTEVANLAGALTDEYRHALFHRFADSLEVLVEQYVPAKEAVRAAPYFKFGLTDSVIFTLARKELLLLTDDFPLSQFAAANGIDTINFNHIRPLAWTQ